MKKILAYLSPEKYACLFDVIVGYDGGADAVVPYCGLTEEDVRDMVHSCVFTRHPKKLHNTALFIGGHDVTLGEAMMEKAVETFESLPGPFKVSVACDPDGAYTTSSAAAAKISGVFEEARGVKAAVLAGTGPVGQRIAVLLAKDGFDVALTSRKQERAEGVCNKIKEKYGVEVTPIEANVEASIEAAVSQADVVVTTAPEGVRVLPEKIWKKYEGIKVLADANAVPPYGIEGVEPTDDLKEQDGRRLLGAIAIGDLKMKVHLKLIKELFERNDRVFDLMEVHKLTQGLVE